MFLQNNCINKGVTNGLKQKKEKKHAKQLYLVVYTTTVNFQMNIVYRRKIKNGKKREGGGGRGGVWLIGARTQNIPYLLHFNDG